MMQLVKNQLMAFKNSYNAIDECDEQKDNGTSIGASYVHL
jgi:hypothetical protein